MITIDRDDQSNTQYYYEKHNKKTRIRQSKKITNKQKIKNKK